jgi:hypothetical protein
MRSGRFCSALGRQRVGDLPKEESLVVIEGPDSSGRSTRISLLSRWLEQKG